MRNSAIFLNYAEMICDYNFSKVAQEKIQTFIPKNSDNLFLHTLFRDWAPKLLSKLDEIKTALKAAGQKENLQVLEAV